MKAIPEKKPEQLKFNLPQMLTILAKQPDIYLEWGRGTGKSTIIGKRIETLIHQMPRMSGTIVGETYQQILTRTLPSTISSLERLGLKKDVHFFVGRKPPASWKWNEPYEPPLSYEHYIIFYTGAGFHLVSQDRAGSGRGLNIDAVIGDEAALLDLEKLFNDVLATNRGNLNRFSHCALHHATLFASTIPMTFKGKWLYKMEEEAKQNPKQTFYLRASAMENLENLGMKWFRDNKRKLPSLIYNAEILNIRPTQIEGGFYSQFSEEKHCYNAFNYSFLDGLNFTTIQGQSLDCRQDGDLIKNMPLDIALDYGASINNIVCGQEASGKFRFLSHQYVKTPLLIKHLIKNFCNYYSSHQCREVNYYYDHTAVAASGVSTITYADEVTNCFRENGWTVNRIYIGQAPKHHIKFLFWSSMLSDDPRLPSVLFNKSNCKMLIISIQNAPVRQGKDGFEKDKSSERNPAIDQAEATHPSDAADTLVFGKYSSLLKDGGDTMPTVFN